MPHEKYCQRTSELTSEHSGAWQVTDDESSPPFLLLLVLGLPQNLCPVWWGRGWEGPKASSLRPRVSTSSSGCLCM